MMRVALVTEQLRRPTPGGIGRYTACLRDALEGRRDVEVEDVQGRLPTEIAARLWSFGVPRHLGADVVHATSFAFPRTIPRVPTTVFVHDLLWRGVGSTSLNARGHRFHDRGLRHAAMRASRLLVPSHTVRRALVDEGISPGDVVVTGEGADHLPLRPRQVTEHVVLSVGTLEPRKNLPRLLMAFEEVRRTISEPVVLRLVGSDSWRGSAGLPRELPDGVEAVGTVSDDRLAELLSSATVFVYPSMGEGFGLPPVEAMRAGVPVVCAPMPSVLERTDEDASGRLPDDGLPFEAVEATDVSSISRALQHVLGSADRRSELSELGSAWVQDLTWDAVARRHVEVWEELL